MLKIILFVFLIFPNVLFANTIFSDKDIKCLADTVYHEARSLGNKERLFIIQVVLNRVKDSRFPNDICKTVYQKKQFSWTRFKTLDIKEKEKYDEIVSLVKNYQYVDHDYLFFEKKESKKCYGKKYKNNFCHRFRREYGIYQ